MIIPPVRGATCRATHVVHAAAVIPGVVSFVSGDLVCAHVVHKFTYSDEGIGKHERVSNSFGSFSRRAVAQFIRQSI